MSNSTAPIHESAAFLYANTDFSKLNWLELQWAAWYLWIDNPIIATGLMSFLLHEVRHIVFLHISPQKFTKLPCTDCLLWSLHPMDYHRRHSLLPQVEVATWQNPYARRAMGMHQAGFV